MVGASSGAVAGLVAITPACGFITPWASVLLGLVAGAVCALAVSLKYKFGFDDSLDVFGVHFVGGWIGSLWIGLFASIAANPNIASVNGAANGLFNGGGLTQLGRQAVCSGIVTVFSFTIAFVLGKLIDITIGFRTTKEVEVDGIDVAEHAESAYDLAPTSGGSSAFALAGIGGATETPAEAPESEKVAG
jgi:Amt family ammonium transporter